MFTFKIAETIYKELPKLKSFISISQLTSNVGKLQIRNYASPPKRFYKNTGILRTENKFEVCLDERRLKTPNGNIFTVESEPLALAVAAEWNAQKDKIIQSSMHLTMLCNSALDNPNNLTKYDVISYIVNYLDTDTILYQSDNEEELFKLQTQEWDPIIDWFNKLHGLNLKKCIHMDVPAISDQDKNLLTKHLLSYNFECLFGLMYGVDTLKSVILTLACVEKYIIPQKAVLLSRLEEEYQTGLWGRVEWAHDLNQQDLQARLSAVILFVYFNSQSTNVQSKQKNQ
ncbi:ATP synthase mitochondrial F1 complex assembly factor 2 [Diorhabda carinulata]|uniref:ATP synthase mitochondrial F1 complex assembly factor 2 n=1 Tax=Diorhabda sublineata TaxID=1163346 RepID=UPI0024E13AB3|nr:ATP synthase mitochondrial F1 complex assembly factor 2 [Diorhabda sublineata]XP_057657057.1 ATP synthase mitochondrial F1 complex assembly factor 2 [Diorhabda carinulata]